MYRASYRCQDEHVIGVIDVTPKGDDDEDVATPNLLQEVHPLLDKSKIHERNSPLQWWVNDLPYFHKLVKLLTLENKLESSSPYKEILLAEDNEDYLDGFESFEEEGRCLFEWDRLPKRCVPFDYQLEALHAAIIKHEGRSMAALTPGSGKTLIGVLFLYYWAYELKMKGDLLVICENSKVLDWSADWTYWTGKTTKRITACSYEYASRHVDELLNKNFIAVVVDECHKLKNPLSQRSAGLSPLIKSINFAILLSGTPQINRVSELENQLSAMRPDVFNSRDVFLKRFASGKLVNGKQDERGLEVPWELDFLLSKVIFRRNDIRPTVTPKTRQMWVTAPTAEQMAEQDTMTARRQRLNATIARIRDPAEKARLVRTRDALLLKMLRSAGVWKSTNAVACVKEIIEKHRDKKIVFFSFQIKVLASMKAAVDEMQLGDSVMATGRTSKAERKRIIDLLKDPDHTQGPRFGFFTQCMGTGVTLCPGVTVEVILELEFSPAAMRQKEDRIWRVGTVEEVNIYWMLCGHSYDEEVLAIVQNKANESRHVMGSDQGSFVFHTVNRLPLPVIERPVKKQRTKKVVKKAEVPALQSQA